MKKILIAVLYSVGVFLFARFFFAPLNYIMIVLFLGGLAVSIFVMYRTKRFLFLKDMFWLISFFLWAANIFGFLADGLNFTSGIFLVFSVAFLIFWASLPKVGRRRNFVYSFAGALIVSEFFWAIAFLPFGYLTLAGLIFIVFYLIWMIFYYYLRENLSREIILKNLAFGAAMTMVLFLSTPWQP